MKSTSGFSYIEVLLAILVLAGAVIAASHALAAARDGEATAARHATAEGLLQDAIVMVRRLPRLEPKNPVFGLEPGETVADDVDDLVGLVETGPTDLGGTTFDKDWTRTWSVASAGIDDPLSKATDGSTSLLRVRIGVAYAASELATGTLWLARTP